MSKEATARSAMKLALEALEISPMSRKNKDAIDTLREALAEQPAQRTWVGLSDAELVKFSSAKLGPYDLCLEVEAFLKELNT